MFFKMIIRTHLFYPDNAVFHHSSSADAQEKESIKTQIANFHQPWAPLLLVNAKEKENMWSQESNWLLKDHA